MSKLEKATNGETYVKTGKNTVRKITNLNNLKDYINEDAIMQTSYLEQLHSFLKSKDDNASIRKNKNQTFVSLRDFRISFDPKSGVIITDTKNFNKPCEDFEEAMPTPRDIWEFITSKIGNTKKTDKKFKYIPAYESESKDIPFDQKNHQNLTSEDLELYRQKLLKALEGLTPKKMNEVVFKFLPNRKFNHRVNKLRKGYESKDLRPGLFKKKLLELVSTHDFSPPRKPAKKFIGLDWFEIKELSNSDNNIVSLKTRGDGNFNLSKSEFIARYILSEFPKMMPQMYRALNSIITYEDFISEPILQDDIDAKFIDFDRSVIRGEGHNEELYSACTRLLLDEEEVNPLSIVYKNDAPDIKKGDYIEVLWRDMHAIYKGKVITTQNGIRIRYEDGDTANLYKWQEYKIISKRA